MLGSWTHFTEPPHASLPKQEAERRTWRRPVKQGTRCSVYVLDFAELAVQHGIPGCREDDYVTELHESKILPDPRNTGYEVPLKTRPEHELAYPYEFGPHHVAQSSGPWCVAKTFSNVMCNVF
jgi:hypothetical protein